MQTFLPFADFAESARVLDRQRLGKQRVEVMQILKALGVSVRSAKDDAGVAIANTIAPGGAWSNHPATKMWRGYESALCAYGLAVVAEWVKRGYKNSIQFPEHVGDNPPWVGDERFHSAHRAALLFKNPEWYGQFGWAEEPQLDYWWPV